MSLYKLTFVTLLAIVMARISDAVFTVNTTVIVGTNGQGLPIVLPYSTTDASKSFTAEIYVLNANGSVNSKSCSYTAPYNENVTLTVCQSIVGSSYWVKVFDSQVTSFLYANQTETINTIVAANYKWHVKVHINLLKLNTTVGIYTNYSFTSQYYFDEINFGTSDTVDRVSIVYGSNVPTYSVMEVPDVRLCVPSAGNSSTIVCAFTDDSGVAILATPMSMTNTTYQSSLTVSANLSLSSTFPNCSSWNASNVTTCKLQSLDTVVWTQDPDPIVVDSSRGTIWIGFSYYGGNSVIIMPNTTSTFFIYPGNAWVNGGTRFRVDVVDMPSYLTVVMREGNTVRENLTSNGTYGIDLTVLGLEEGTLSWNDSWDGTWNGSVSSVYFDFIQLQIYSNLSEPVDLGPSAGIRLSWLNIWTTAYYVWMPIIVMYSFIIVVSIAFFTYRHYTHQVGEIW